MPSVLATKTINILTPSLGDFLARAKVQAACMMAKLDIETLDQSQVPQFVEKFELICANSFGSEVTKSIKAKVLSF